MANPFILLPTSVAGAGKTILLSDTGPLFPVTAEPEAKSHWLFGTDYPNYDDLISNQRLTNAGSTAPTLSSNYVAFAAGYNGLYTPYDHARNRTICHVFKHTALRNYGMIGGSWDSGAQLDNFWIDSGNYRYQTIDASGGQSDALMTPPSGLSAGQWSFIALSHDDAGVNRWIWGANSGVSATRIMRVTSGKKYIIGPAHNLADSQTAIAETIIFDRVLTPAEVAAVRARSIARMAKRSLTITA